MDSQLPTNQEQPQTQITPEQLEEMKMMARQQAIQQITQQRQSVQQPEVVYGGSDLMVDVFVDIGRHARFAVGVGSLPRGVAVEVDGVFELYK